MKITYQSILDSIYASSALATLNPDNHATLVHSDHAMAISKLIPDAVSIILARSYRLSVNVRFDTAYFEIDVPENVTPEIFENALRPALVAVICYIIRLSACESPVFPKNELDTLEMTIRPVYDAKISPRRY